MPRWGNDIADGAGSLGGHFEAGYYATENVGIGAFVAFQNNEEDHLTSTDTGYAPDTEQRNRLYQLPFGLSGRYRWAAPDALFTPYVALKLGAEYAESNLYVANMQTQLHSWGFFLSPEVGTEIYPFHRCKFGFHVALYYSFATNDASLAGLSARRLHNCGARFGVAFLTEGRATSDKRDKGLDTSQQGAKAHSSSYLILRACLNFAFK